MVFLRPIMSPTFVHTDMKPIVQLGKPYIDRRNVPVKVDKKAVVIHPVLSNPFNSSVMAIKEVLTIVTSRLTR